MYFFVFFFNLIKMILVACSHKEKRAKQIKKLIQKGLLDPEKADAFSLFLQSGDLTHCLYKHSEKVIGNTYGMCVLQVFYTSY
jgi:N-acetyltransferase 10